MAERVNEQVGATPVETTSRGMFDFMKKDEVEKPIKEETFASEFDHKVQGDEVEKPIKEETLASDFDHKVQVSDPVEAEYQDALEKKFGATPEEAEYKDAEEKRQGANPLETTDHSLFDLIQNDTENKIPVTEETFGSEFDHKAPVSEPAEYKDQDEKKHGTVVEMLRSYSSSDEEGDDEEKKQRKKEKKGLKEKLVEKLPGHKDEVAEDTHVPIEKPHVQEAVYSEPPHQEEEPEKKSFLDKIKDKLPGHNKTEDSHDEAVPLSVEPVVKGEEEDKKGFMDKIKDKIPGLSSSKTSDEKNDHVDKY
ncbi:uncharacterized protein LOC141611528 [Silene latifolia]|uniref:uncharacterized protein LOC141611528 n=1 Tax=Silene latifolia TaxID=37657 RepID=UPI003D7780FD